MIGPEGGTLSTQDQLATLVLPKGALSQSTNITIQEYSQPVADGGSSSVLQLSPNGLAFSQGSLPLLRYRYSASDVETFSPNVLTIETRGHDGGWISYGNVRELDPDAGYIGVELLHFSPQRLKRSCVLSLDAYSILTSEVIGVELDCTGLPDHENAPQYELFPPTQANSPVVIQGTVNGVPNGDAVNGTIACQKTVAKCRYTAPAVVPADRHVPIVISFTGSAGINSHPDLYKALLKIGVTARIWTLQADWRNDLLCGGSTSTYFTLNGTSQCDGHFTLDTAGNGTTDSLVSRGGGCSPGLCPGATAAACPGGTLTPGPIAGCSLTSLSVLHDRFKDVLKINVTGTWEDVPPLQLQCSGTTNTIPASTEPIDLTFTMPPEDGAQVDFARHDSSGTHGVLYKLAAP